MTSTVPNAPELTDEGENATMSTGDKERSQRQETAEDTIARQQEQIDKLIANSESLKSQIEKLIRGTATGDDKQTQSETHYSDTLTPEQMENLNSEKYISLQDLGAEFGKREYKNINTER